MSVDETKLPKTTSHLDTSCKTSYYKSTLTAQMRFSVQAKKIIAMEIKNKQTNKT